MIINLLKTPGSNLPANVVGLELPTTDNGASFTTLVNVDSANGVAAADALSQLVPVTIIGTSEETSKGIRRVLVKAELPYASLQKCSCGDTEDYTVDTAKSGSLISMHCVLTLPRQAAKDLTAGGVTADGVITRIAILQYMLDTLIRTTRFQFLPQEQDTAGATRVTFSNGILQAGGLTLNPLNPWIRGANLLKPFLTAGEYGVTADR